jgi:hypothetical protein
MTNLLNLISIKSLLWFVIGSSILFLENFKKIQLLAFISLILILFSVPNVTDTAHYLAALKSGPLYGNEFGYLTLQKLLISFLSPEGAILVIKSLILSIPLIYVYKTNKNNFFYISNLYLLTVFLFLSFTNNLRQGICLTFFGIGFLSFNRNKYISMISFLLAFSFHYFSVPFLIIFSTFFALLNLERINSLKFIGFITLSIILIASTFNQLVIYFGFESWTISNSWAEPSRFDTRAKVLLVTVYILITNYFIKIDQFNFRTTRLVFIFFIINLLIFSVNYEIINRIIYFIYAFDAFVLLYFLTSRINLKYCKLLTIFYLISPNIYKILIK